MAIKIIRKKMWITLLLIVLLLVALSFTGFEIRKDIVINASKEQVWHTIIDFRNYKRWNTQLSFLGGEVKPKGKLHLKLSIKGSDPYEFKPVISHWEENKQFAWLAITGVSSVFDGEHFFEIKELENGKTLLVNREEYKGILSFIMKNLPMMKEAPAGFEKMNEELKYFIESHQSL